MPQLGTILGPLLFSIFINDLPSVIKHSKCVLYADDTAIFYAGKNIDGINQRLNQDMECISQWLCNNRLCLNASKSNRMLIGSIQRLSRIGDHNINVFVNNVRLEQVSHVKYLGVHIDCNLKWTHHINYVISEVNKRIGILYS